MSPEARSCTSHKKSLHIPTLPPPPPPPPPLPSLPPREQEYASFLCLANLLRRDMMSDFYSMDMDSIRPYMRAFEECVRREVPDVSEHFEELGISTDLYLIDWYGACLRELCNFLSPHFALTFGCGSAQVGTDAPVFASSRPSLHTGVGMREGMGSRGTQRTSIMTTFTTVLCPQSAAHARAFKGDVCAHTMA